MKRRGGQAANGEEDPSCLRPHRNQRIFETIALTRKDRLLTEFPTPMGNMSQQLLPGRFRGCGMV
jgi:hypothetical protein